jgi:hypothetical protein
VRWGEGGKSIEKVPYLLSENLTALLPTNIAYRCEWGFTINVNFWDSRLIKCWWIHITLLKFGTILQLMILGSEERREFKCYILMCMIEDCSIPILNSLLELLLTSVPASSQNFPFSFGILLIENFNISKNRTYLSCFKAYSNILIRRIKSCFKFSCPFLSPWRNAILAWKHIKRSCVKYYVINYTLIKLCWAWMLITNIGSQSIHT